MKFDETPAEYKDKAEFACQVCMARYKSEHTGKYSGCACRNIGKEYCPYIEQIIQKQAGKIQNT